jgi:hypothetical protein
MATELDIASQADCYKIHLATGSRRDETQCETSVSGGSASNASVSTYVGGVWQRISLQNSL